MMRAVLIAFALLALPLTAGAQGKKIDICQKTIPGRLTVTESGVIVFGSPPGSPTPGTPGQAIAVNDSFTIFGSGPTCQSGDGCPTGAVSVDCTQKNPEQCTKSALPTRAVYAAADGSSDGTCRSAAPPGGTPLGPCCVCTWRRRLL